ncbi:MAG: 3-phosphoshikimate 1-carboxyvinyltransferase, partial [Candidatus Limnocylindria bacterium]
TDGHAPLRVAGCRPLRALEHQLPVASAQLVAAIALAALAADGTTRIVSPGPTRDHTERLLAAMGVAIHREANATTLKGPATPHALSLRVPGDPSAAAAWLVAATVHPDADLTLTDVAINPTRLAVVDALREMGADITVMPKDVDGPEPVGDVRVRTARRLEPLRLDGARVPALIDELALLGVAMAAAEGESELRGAAELRVKESDRVASTVAGLAAIGARVEELPDGWRVRRGRAADASVLTHGDHRIAIAFAVAALAGVAGEVRLDDPACVSVSYPSFWDDMAVVAG